MNAGEIRTTMSLGLRRVLDRAGYDLVPKHFYSPIPDVRSLPSELWASEQPTPGLELHLDAAARLLTEELAPHIDGWDFPVERPHTGRGFYLRNGFKSTGVGDDLALYMKVSTARAALER